jgi:hypothetical protein
MKYLFEFRRMSRKNAFSQVVFESVNSTIKTAKFSDMLLSGMYSPLGDALIFIE